MNKEVENNTSPLASDIKIMALGGLGEVGKNSYVIDYDNKIYIIDFGVLFPDKDILGVDYIIPNYTYLKENEDRIVGIFITHGHEDHIGGIPFLLKKVKIPAIYAPLTAKLMIEKKFKEHKLEANLIEINDRSEIKLGNVTMYTFRQTHSIPDALGLFFETPAGNIVSTGDFKIDLSPPGQKTTDFHKIAWLSNKGVDIMLADSTNAQTPGFSLSENIASQNLKLLIKETEGRIIFTTFASNINRIQQIIEGTLENNRKLCVMGRSLSNALQIGQKTGYLNIKNKDIVEPKHLKNHKPEDVVIVCTGSQGESLAALSRMATGQNQHVSLDQNDTVVFASNPIPGNNFPIGKVIDSLTRINCKVIVNSADFRTHASGHASQEEGKIMLALLRPKYFLPVHGTFNMLQESRKQAVSMGYTNDNVFIIDNGEMLVLPQRKDKRKPYSIPNTAPGSAMLVSGNNINVNNSDGMMDKLASDGILLFTAIYDKNRRLISYPQTITRGFIVINESIQLLKQIQAKFIECYNKNSKMPHNELEAKLNELMTEFVHKQTGKLPMVNVSLIPFDKQNSQKFMAKQAKKAQIENGVNK